MAKLKVFVDSDVVISSLISETGAAHLLINQTDLEPIISNFSTEEQEIVVERLELDKGDWNKLVKTKFQTISLKESKANLIKQFNQYVHDINDAHIVAGAKKSKVKFLITYNIRDFKSEAIKQKLGITILTPARFLQYLRSLE